MRKIWVLIRATKLFPKWRISLRITLLDEIELRKTELQSIVPLSL